jgi:hypothetical protein
MKKTLIAGLVGGVILFVWSFLAWTVFPLHEPSLHRMTNEDAVIAALQPQLRDKAVYMFPKGPGMSADKATMDAWTEKMRRGPTGLIFYDPQGSDPMMASQMVIGLILDILSAALIAWFLARSTAMTASFLARAAYCAMFAIFVSVYTHLMSWNWMGYPVDFTVGLILDGIIGCFLAGLGIAAIIKPPSAQPAKV